MFATIVWAIDDSARSDAAYGYVRDVCERHDSSLRLVHVARPLAAGGDGQIAKLKAMTAALRRHGVDASLHVVRGAIGSPAPHIGEVARMAGAGLVIVASRGRSPLIGALAGSVTQRLLAEAPCPVLILPPPAAPKAVRRSA
jgi:nucleotide-binding universal stress UspA family protein